MPGVVLAVEPEEVSDEPAAVLPDPLDPELIEPLPDWLLEGEVEAVEPVSLPELVLPLLEGVLEAVELVSLLEGELEVVELVSLPELMPLPEGEAEVEGLVLLRLVSLAATLLWSPLLPVVVGR